MIANLITQGDNMNDEILNIDEKELDGFLGEILDEFIKEIDNETSEDSKE